ncbi:MAG: isoprenylcysteine carboxylmethyltransferase family protein [Lachnospiraceae bacterium]|nr:isoprenylcysteine carboxylmethyltransferase family protein [Lachnospiraceae bacterium]
MIIKIVTFALMAMFYVCYFTKMIAQKKQGINTDQLGKGKEGFIKFIEVTLKIATYLLPVIQVVSIVLYVEEEIQPLQILGAGIIAFGVLAFVLSVLQMKDNWRAGVQREEKTDLVTTGIYSISRNPAFLGFDLMYIGILLSFFNWILCVATGAALVLFHLQIVNVEEDFLLEAFGEDYLKYKKKVCRYIGRKGLNRHGR